MKQNQIRKALNKLNRRKLPYLQIDGDLHYSTAMGFVAQHLKSCGVVPFTDRGVAHYILSERLNQTWFIGRNGAVQLPREKIKFKKI